MLHFRLFVQTFVKTNSCVPTVNLHCLGLLTLLLDLDFSVSSGLSQRKRGVIGQVFFSLRRCLGEATYGLHTEGLSQGLCR